MVQKIFRRRLAAFLCLIFIAGLASLGFVQRQRRIERNARWDRIALQAKQLSEFTPYFDYHLDRECARDELAVRLQMEIARRKDVPAEAEDALQQFSTRLKTKAEWVRRLEQAGSKGGEEQDVALVQSEQAQLEVALAQLHGSGREVRDSAAKYVSCLRRYRDAIRRVSPPQAAGVLLSEIDLASAKAVQAELNRDRRSQIAALSEQLGAVQEFARRLASHESNALAVIAAEYSAARIRARLACVAQDESGERAAWQEALMHVQQLRVAETNEWSADEDPLDVGGGNWGEVDFAMRLPSPNLLIAARPPAHLSPQAESLESAVLEELSALCGEAARQAERHERHKAERDPYWTAWKALAEIQLEDAGGLRDE